MSQQDLSTETANVTLANDTLQQQIPSNGPVEGTNNAELGDAFAEKEQVESTQTSTEQDSQDESQESEQQQHFNKQFAALSRMEKQLRERETELNQRFNELEARIAQSNAATQEPAPQEPAEPWERRLLKNPLEALAEKGLSYEKLTELALNDGKLTPELQMQVMRQEMEEKYRSEIEELKNQYNQDKEEAAQKEYNQVIANFKNELSSFVNENSEYELIRANDAVDLVYEVIEEHYKETGTVLDNAEAAKEVELFLEEELKEKLSKSEKVKRLFGAGEPEPQQPQRQSSPTLSNAMAATASPAADTNKLSREDSLAKLAAQIKWND